jgi:hypothetical protein
MEMIISEYQTHIITLQEENQRLIDMATGLEQKTQGLHQVRAVMMVKKVCKLCEIPPCN